MNEELREVEQFWDEFAAEYEEIQKESAVPIAAAVKDFLLQENYLPCESLLDLAGGGGKYLLAFQPEVRDYTVVDISAEMLRYVKEKLEQANAALIHSDQAAFFAKTKDDAYELVFSAMNPALASKKDLQELDRISRRAVCILRLQQDRDTLFTPLEKRYVADSPPDAQLLAYKQWLTELGYSWQQKRFSFHLQEVVARSFFYRYFASEIAESELKMLTHELFQDAEETVMERTVIFELLYWTKSFAQSTEGDEQR